MKQTDDPRDDRDWRSAAERCLTAALERSRVLVQDCAEPKQLVDIIAKCGELIGMERSTAGGGDEDGGEGDE